MEPETVALLTAVVVFAGALVGLLAKLNKDVAEVHVMVNSRMDEALDRIDQLIETLVAAGIQPPERPKRDD